MPEPSPAQPPQLRRVAGGAAVVGGLCWVVKSAAILAGGEPPDYVLELAPAAQGVALAGLAWVFAAGVLARMVAGLALTLGLSALAAYVTSPESVVYNVALLLATLLVVVGLVLAGSIVATTHALGRWSRLPRRIGLWTVPLFLAGGLLAIRDERLLELPVLALGLAWLWLGVVLLVHRRAPAVKEPGPGKDGPGPRAQPAGASTRT